MSTSPRFCVRVRPMRFYFQRDAENCTNQVLDFYYLIDMNIHTWNLLVCNSGQYIYITGFCNFFFVLQDLIERINSYFQKIAFQRNLLLIGLCNFFFALQDLIDRINSCYQRIASNMLRHKFFPMKIGSLNGNGAV